MLDVVVFFIFILILIIDVFVTAFYRAVYTCKNAENKLDMRLVKLICKRFHKKS